MRFLHIKSTNKHKSVSKQGFTLLETMLSIALLLVLTLIIYQGFVSTIQISTNSALYSKSGAAASGNVYSQMANTAINSSTVAPGAIHLKNMGGSPVFEKNLGVVTFKSTPTTNTAFGDAAYRESTTLSSTNRHGFIYCGKALT